MPNLEFQAKGFTVSALNVNRPADVVAWDDVFKAAITVGHRDEAALRQFGMTSWFEALSRLFRIRMALTDGAWGQIQLTDLFQKMDPSEKAVVSYYLGLAFCKLYAERHLRTPWLMHHDVYRAYLGSSLIGVVRPDLVGLSVDNRWAVFEAKGRRRTPSIKAQAQAKTQARSLPSVQGIPVTWAITSWTCIYKNGIRVLWEDPKPPTEQDPEHSLNLRVEDLLKHYYRPLLALQTLTSPDLARAVQPIASLFANMGLRLEIDHKLHPLLLQEAYGEAFRYLHERASTTTGVPNASDYGLDGVRVEVG